MTTIDDNIINADFPIVRAAREFLEQSSGVKFEGDHLERTPARFASMMRELNTAQPFNFTMFDNVEAVDEMVTVGPIEYYSLCAHHVIPFFGKAWISYIPGPRVAGISKLARTVKFFQRGLWVQEHLTNTIADFIVEQLDPLGVGVVMNGRHLCMEMRGVETPGASTTTSAMRGVYSDHTRLARQEFLTFIKESK